jgi:hypothetical protein
MFGFLAQECADLFIGTGVARKYPAWSQVHRALEHGVAKNACERAANLNFPPEIVQFATLFIAMQEQRHNADYEPSARFTRAEVIASIDNAEQAIRDFKKAKRQDRLAFAALVLLRRR